MLKESNTKPVAVIFGASLSGKSALKAVKDEYQIIAFVDNGKEKHGTKVNGLTVYPVSKLIDLKFDKVLIASEFAEKIHHQLTHDLQIAAENIFELPNRITKPLQFGSDPEFKALTIQILLLVCERLNQANARYYVDAGTLLGIYRDGELIPWDDDLDLAIADSEIELVKTVVVDTLPALEALTGDTWQLVSHFSEQDFGAVKKGDIRGFKLKSTNDDYNLPMMDFFIKYVDKGVMDYTLASRGFRMPSEHILSLEQMTFAGGEINIPSQPELYLTRHYGDWKTPNKDWNLSELKNATVF